MALRGAGFGIRDIDAVIGSKHDDDSPTQRVDAGLAVLAELSRQLDARQAALDEARALCTRWQRELRAASKALAAGASPEDLLNEKIVARLLPRLRGHHFARASQPASPTDQPRVALMVSVHSAG